MHGTALHNFVMSYIIIITILLSLVPSPFLHCEKGSGKLHIRRVPVECMLPVSKIVFEG